MQFIIGSSAVNKLSILQ